MTALLLGHIAMQKHKMRPTVITHVPLPQRCALQKRLNRSRFCLAYELLLNQETVLLGGSAPQDKADFLNGNIYRPITKYREYPACEQAIFSNLFRRWQQRCRLLPPALHQLIVPVA